MSQWNSRSKGLIIGIMAVLAAMVVAVIATLAVTQSGSSSKTDSAATSAQAPAAVNSGQQVKTSGGNFTRPEGAVLIGDVMFTVGSVKTLSIEPPEKRFKYVLVEITAQNVGEVPQRSWSWRLIDSDGRENINVMGVEEPARLGQLGQQFRQFILGDINNLEPGAQVQGPLIFKMLDDAKPVQLGLSSPKMGVSGVIPLKQ